MVESIILLTQYDRILQQNKYVGLPVSTLLHDYNQQSSDQEYCFNQNVTCHKYILNIITC